MSGGLAVVVSRYPALSHAFIRREVEALRRAGARVVTASLRRPGTEELLTDADRRERDQTFYVLPVGPVSLLRDHAWALLQRPARTLSTLALALSHRGAGLRGALWAVFHFAEGVRLARELDRQAVTHVHAHFANAGGTVSMLASELLGTGFSLTLHGLSDFGDPTGQRIAEKIARARFVVCVSEDGRQRARALAPERAECIHVVRCGLAPESFLERAQGDLPGCREGALRLVSVGRLAPEKAHTDLVGAVGRLRARGLDVRLRIIGEGPERGLIEARVRDEGLADRIELPGPLGGDALRDALAAADVFVLSSRMEGLPVTLMEALAVGTPAVAPRLAGIPELVRDGEDGFLYETGDVDALTDALARACSARDRLAALGRSGRERVRAMHDVDRNVGVLHGLIARSATGGPLAAARTRE